MPKNSHRLLLGWALACAFAGSGWAQETKPPPSAEITVRGLGWWQDRGMKRNLGLLLRDQRGQTYGANAIQDGALLILTTLADEGYLKPKLEITAIPPTGAPMVWTYQEDVSPVLPDSLAARTVEYRVERGKRYRVARVELEGLQALSADAGLAYFQDRSAFAGNPWRLPYSPGGLQRMLKQLRSALRELGYADVRLEVPDLQIDSASGDVTLRVRVTEGHKWTVSSVRVEGGEAVAIPASLLQPFRDRPWTATLEHDLTSEVRNVCYRLGYPDATVQTVHEVGAVADGVQPLDLKVSVKIGPLIRVAEVRFAGAVRTRPSILQSRVGVKPGALLDPGMLEEARLDLVRLESFRTVGLTYEPGEGDTRYPLFTVQESEVWESSVMLGYGSFDQLRVGFEVRHFNFLGYAGQGDLKLVQAQKGSRADLGYSFPQLFGRRINSTASAYGLRREEFLLERREMGLRLGFTRPLLRLLGASVSAGYTYERLEYVDAVQTFAATSTSGNTTSASLEFNVTRDRRDNILRPREGHRWFLQGELADPRLGGSSQFQRFELGFTRHQPLANGLWLHVGFTHGVVASSGAGATDLPVNKLFFPGGDNSIRGYGQGEASPINAAGDYTGARSYAVLNLEAEFALSKTWSVVVFSDSLGTAIDLADYPFDEGLFSLGAGVRYQSLIGPIRLEYGHNLNPRPKDPSGTLLFSLGFPF